jgi:hypothetical protein
MWATMTPMCPVGHKGDIILYFGSKKNIFIWCKSDKWDQHDIFTPRKQNTICGSMLTELLVFHA